MLLSFLPPSHLTLETIGLKLSKLSQLKTLRMVHNKLENVEKIGQLLNCLLPTIEEVDFRENPAALDQSLEVLSFVAGLCKPNRLAVVNGQNLDHQRKFIYVLRGGAYSSNEERLLYWIHHRSLASNSLSIDLSYLAASLKEIDLSHCFLETLETIGQFYSLEKLVLSDNLFYDESVSQRLPNKRLFFMGEN